MLAQGSLLQDCSGFRAEFAVGQVLIQFYTEKICALGLWTSSRAPDLKSMAVSPRELSAKLVGAREFTAKAEDWLRAQGIRIEKTVERRHSFEVLFDAPSKSLRVSKEPIGSSSSTSITNAQPKAIHEKPKQPQKLRILIVDDSKTIRSLLENIFSRDQGLEVVGSLGDPTQVEAFLASHSVDVMTLDVHMPGMTGVDVLRQVMPKHPVPTVLLTSLSISDGPLVLQALELGAVDYVQKPQKESLNHFGAELVERLRQASTSKVRVHSSRKVAPRAPPVGLKMDTKSVVAIGSSTGGTEALREVLTGLPSEVPPILIVQHIPAVFSAALATRLNDLCKFRVKEAEDGEIVQANCAYIAPGGKQMMFRRTKGHLQVRITDDPPVNRHKPSVDYMFDSLLELEIPHLVGVILTGMGADGAKGLLRLKEQGAWTIGQNEESCVVYGMPRAAFEMGATCEVLAISDIAASLCRATTERRRSPSQKAS